MQHPRNLLATALKYPWHVKALLLAAILTTTVLTAVYVSPDGHYGVTAVIYALAAASTFFVSFISPQEKGTMEREKKAPMELLVDLVVRLTAVLLTFFAAGYGLVGETDKMLVRVAILIPFIVIATIALSLASDYAQSAMDRAQKDEKDTRKQSSNRLPNGPMLDKCRIPGESSKDI